MTKKTRALKCAPGLAAGAVPFEPGSYERRRRPELLNHNARLPTLPHIFPALLEIIIAAIHVIFEQLPTALLPQLQIRGGEQFYRLALPEQVPAVRIHLPPPRSLRYGAFSGGSRKKRACGGNAPAPPAPERAHMSSHCRVTSIFSLWASNSVPMPSTDTLHGRNLRTSRAVRGVPQPSSF
jgi:hypothetical protein